MQSMLTAGVQFLALSSVGASNLRGSTSSLSLVQPEKLNASFSSLKPNGPSQIFSLSSQNTRSLGDVVAPASAPTPASTSSESHTFAPTATPTEMPASVDVLFACNRLVSKYFDQGCSKSDSDTNDSKACNIIDQQLDEADCNVCKTIESESAYFDCDTSPDAQICEELENMKKNEGGCSESSSFDVTMAVPIVMFLAGLAYVYRAYKDGSLLECILRQ